MKTGELIEDFELLDQDGNPQRLSTLLQNGPVVLFFYPAAMTGGCTKEACHFRDLASEFAAAGAQRVGISMDAVDKQKKFSNMHSFDYPLLSDPDGTVAKAFGVKRRIAALLVKRHTFVIGTDRRLIKELASELNMDMHADDALKALAAARAADVPGSH
jgi:peroxiredoxin Q/BCP